MKNLIMIFVAAFIATNAYAQNKDLGFNNQSELGYLVVGGNAKSQALSAKTTLGYNWDWDLLKFNAYYFYSNGSVAGNNVEIAKNWGAALRYERVITPDVFNLYAAIGMYGDKFKNLDNAKTFDVGAKYVFWKNENTTWFGEGGYKLSAETYYPIAPSTDSSSVTTNFLRLFSQIDHKYHESLSVGFWAEYLPALNSVSVNGNNIPAVDNYRINFSPYMLARLNNTFSLKFAYEGNYRNAAPAFGNDVAGNPLLRMDFRHTTTLIATF